MTRAISLFAMALACKNASSIETSDAAPATSTSNAPITSAPVASVLPRVPDTRTAVHVVADRWNDAHNTRDASAFEAVYAPTVNFYGQSLSRAECAKRKMSALAKSPAYHQTIHSWMYGQDETPDSEGRTRVIFTKTTIEKGKTTDYIQLLTIDRSLHVTEEIDRTSEANLAKASWSWCLDGYNEANDKIRAPFKLSLQKALEEFVRSKHFAALQASAPAGSAYGADGYDCTASCVTSAPRECGFDIRIADAAATTPSHLVEWVYVDGVTNVLWYQDLRPDAGLDTWLSEPLTHP
jgi:hypothetical protein